MAALQSRMEVPQAVLAAADIRIPSTGRFALPDWLGKGPNFEAAKAMSNTSTSTTSNTQHNTFHINALDGASVQAWANANAPKLAASLGRYYDRNPSKRPR